MKANIYLMRHGHGAHQTNEGVEAGKPAELTDKGVLEVSDAATETIKDLGITNIISSDILRAQQTAEIVQKVLGDNGHALEIEENKLLREKDHFENKNVMDLEQHKSVHKRTMEFAKQLRERIENGELGENVLIVGHQFTNSMIQYLLLKGSSEEFSMDEFLASGAGTMSNASVYEIDMSVPKGKRESKMVHGDKDYRVKHSDFEQELTEGYMYQPNKPVVGDNRL
jgi:broad specificity phosphatase PhoE